MKVFANILFLLVAFFALNVSMAFDGFIDDNDSKQGQKFVAYPNPASDRVNIEIDLESEIVFYDLVGQKVEVNVISEIEKKNSISYTFDLQGLPKGLYFVKVRNIGNQSNHLIKLKKL